MATTPLWEIHPYVIVYRVFGSLKTGAYSSNQCRKLKFGIFDPYWYTINKKKSGRKNIYPILIKFTQCLKKRVASREQNWRTYLGLSKKIFFGKFFFFTKNDFTLAYEVFSIEFWIPKLTRLVDMQFKKKFKICTTKSYVIA